MKCNVGKTDKIIRIILGLVVIILGIALKSWLGLIGIILLVTAFIGWCPLYGICRISTSKVEEVKEEIKEEKEEEKKEEQ